MSDLDRMNSEATACGADAFKMRGAADVIRQHCRFGEPGYAEMAECMRGLIRVAEILQSKEGRIRKAMLDMPGYEQWNGDPVAELLEGITVPRQN